MLRRIILLLVLLFLAAALLLGTLMWRSAQPANPPPIASPTPLTPIPPEPDYCANTILPNPFPADPALAPTLVSLNLHQADIQDALDELADDADCTAAPLYQALARGRPTPRIDLHLQDQPWLEAMLQFQAQASATFTLSPGPQISALLTPRKALPGVWCVSGPFAFILDSIHHSINVDRDGQPAKPAPAAAIEGPPEDLYLRLTTLVEPKIRLLQFPGQLHYLEVTDENANSLIPTGPALGPARYDKPLSPYYPTITSHLAYPRQNPGRTIVRLKATAEILIQTASETLEIKDPMSGPPAAKTLAGMTVSIGQLQWNPQMRQLTLAVTYGRGTLNQPAWTALCPALVKARLEVFPPSRTPRTYEGFRSDNAVANPITTTYRVPPDDSSLQIPPKITRLTLEIPTAVRQLTVPLEFKDLPLP